MTVGGGSRTPGGGPPVAAALAGARYTCHTYVSTGMAVECKWQVKAPGVGRRRTWNMHGRIQAIRSYRTLQRVVYCWLAGVCRQPRTHLPSTLTVPSPFTHIPAAVPATRACPPEWPRACRARRGRCRPPPWARCLGSGSWTGVTVGALRRIQAATNTPSTAGRLDPHPRRVSLNF